MAVLQRLNPVLDPPSCRFCGAVITCRVRDMQNGSLGRQEVYSGMIKSCFGIEICQIDIKNTSNSDMCPLCLSQLRQAINFKIQIMQGEQAIEQRMNRGYKGLAKPAMGRPADQFHDDEMSDGLDDVLTEDLLGEYYALGSIIEVANRMNVTSPTSVGCFMSDGVSQSTGSRTYKKVLPNNNEAEKEKQGAAAGIRLDGSEQPFMQAANATAIVKYSYVSPFKNRFNHIMCYYCDEYFLNPDLLREHTMSHDVKEFRPTRYGYTKIDLTRIDCRLCPQKIDNLEDLKRHIISHGKRYFLESKDCTLPFKLVENVNKCAVCGEQFSYFYGLYKHVSQHFSNFICETCGVGVMDEIGLQKHSTAHDGKRYTCTTCGKTFKTDSNRLIHLRRVHEKSAGSFCTKCDAFLLLTEKANHMVEEHGDPPTVPCLGCDQEFQSRRLLALHVRREHMNDCRYECNYCHKRFFTKSSLTHHLPTHTGERNFKCKVCEKTYPRLKTLKEHMRIHNNDRRFRCHICGQAFIQNCSLKGHLKNKHPEKR